MHHSKSLELWQLPDDFHPELSRCARLLYGRLLHLTSGANHTCLYPDSQGAKEFSVRPPVINCVLSSLKKVGLIQTTKSPNLRVVTVVKELAPTAPYSPEIKAWDLPENFCPRLTQGARALYARLLHLTEGGHNSCFYRNKQGAKEFSYTYSAIKQYFRELRKYGLVKTDVIVQGGGYDSVRLVTVVRDRMPNNPHRQDTL